MTKHYCKYCEYREVPEGTSLCDDCKALCGSDEFARTLENIGKRTPPVANVAKVPTTIPDDVKADIDFLNSISSGIANKAAVTPAEPSTVDAGKYEPRQLKEGIMLFVLAGKSYFTIESVKTGTRFTYRVALSKPTPTFPKPVSFVGVLVGQDNWENYKYVGLIQHDGNFRWTAKSTISKMAPSVVAFTYFWNMVLTGQSIEGKVNFYHAGRCGRCGRMLTVPSSIISGYGPECIGKL